MALRLRIGPSPIRSDCSAEMFYEPRCTEQIALAVLRLDPLLG
jgi:hypothetical protein